MAGQLYFPTSEECDSGVIPTRKITVLVTFEDVMQYKQVFKAALRGELNAIRDQLLWIVTGARSHCHQLNYFMTINRMDFYYSGEKIVKIINFLLVIIRLQMVPVVTTVKIYTSRMRLTWDTYTTLNSQIPRPGLDWAFPSLSHYSLLTIPIGIL